MAVACAGRQNLQDSVRGEVDVVNDDTGKRTSRRGAASGVRAEAFDAAAAEAATGEQTEEIRETSLAPPDSGDNSSALG